MSKAEEILESLSIEEKIKLLNGVGSWDTFGAEGKIPVLSMSDGPHGLRRQTAGESYSNINDSNVATCFPTASAVASSWNVDAAKKMGGAIALEAKSENVQLMLGCGMNIKRSPLCGRNFEYFSEDPLLAGEMAASYVNGMQSKNTGSCIKHFAVNSQEKFRQSSSSNVDERTLREIYLAAFERAVKKAQPAAIMTSYNMINGIYASADKKLITDILRSEWGFKGITVSDWGADIDAVKSLKAGLDIGMPDSYGYFYSQIKAAYDKGDVTEKEIDAACKRIIDTVLKFNEHKEEYAGGKDFIPVDYKKQHQTALDLALESAVLLKNDGMLPLKKGTATAKNRLIIAGEFAKVMRVQGGGSSHITTRDYPCALELLEKDFDVVYVRGYDSAFLKKKKKEKINASLREQAVKTLKEELKKYPDTPVLYFCGLEESYEGEGFDREDIKLPQSHIELYNEISLLTKNIALVTFAGSAIDLQFAKEARAVLHMHLCGEACGEAVTALVTGEKNPCGKLSETWPFEVKNGRPVKDVNVNYTEGTLTGYRWYETKNIPVQYEFGFGLSYTEFEYSDLVVEECGEGVAPNCGAECLCGDAVEGDGMDSVHDSENVYTVTCTVKNTGAFDGSEAVQLYVKNPASPEGYTRSVIELRDFKKVFLKAGESKTVSFALNKRAFSVYSVKKNSFRVVGGEYEICIAASARDIRLSKKINVKGETFTDLVLSDREQRESINIFCPHKKGEFTLQDSLGVMAEKSFIVRFLLWIFRSVVIFSSESKSVEDPVVKISLAGLTENPLESLISTSSGAVTEKLARRIVKIANR